MKQREIVESEKREPGKPVYGSLDYVSEIISLKNN